MQGITIISHTISNRLKYVCKVLFGHLLKCDFIIVNSQDNIQSESKVINYTTGFIENTFQVIPSGLIAEPEVQKQQISTGTFEGLPTIFHTDKGHVPFDIFSATFFLLTRYEEYLAFTPDIHGRFPAKESIAFKKGFYKLPIVEHWAKLIATKLEVPFQKSSERQIITIDVDYPWKYKHKGVVKNTGGMLKAMLKGDSKLVRERLLVLLNRKEDPFHTYNYLSKSKEVNNTDLLYFILVGNKSKFDTALSVNNLHFNRLIGSLVKKNQIGIHPSYHSNSSEKILKYEIDKLGAISGELIDKSRQHFLILNLPDTYEQLEKAGIKNDYSMGWHDLPGFRAGMSRSFPFFNLRQNKETELILHPFAIMDRTLKDYMGLSAEEAFVEVGEMKRIINEVGGQFISVWHNDSVSNSGEWSGWRKVFEKAVNRIEEDES